MRGRARLITVLGAACALWGAGCSAPTRQTAQAGAAGERASGEPYVGHLEIWLTDPAAAPFLFPFIWLDGPQLAAGEAARLLGLTGGKGGQGHCVVHLVRHEPRESLWVEQIGAGLGGIAPRAANHYIALAELQGRRWYGNNRIFTVFIRGLTKDRYESLLGFLRNLGEDYERYGYGSPNCADLGAEAWNRVFQPRIPRGLYWFPIDLGAHLVNLPRLLHARLSPLGKLPPMPWRNRTPDQLRRRLTRLGVPHLAKRAIGDVTVDEARDVLARGR